MASSSNKTAQKRLMDDLKQLHSEPLIGANAAPLDTDIMKWYGIVIGGEGTPYAGIPIRFVMEFPDDYPATPPKAFFDTFIAYEGGASYKVDGRLAVCLNLFGNFHHVHTEWKNIVGEGWTPAYTVSTILVTMQGLMMSDMLSNNQLDIEKTKKEALSFVCLTTKHDGSDKSKYFPSVMMTQEEVDQYLLTNGITKTTIYDPLRDHYVCYVKKTTRKDGAILGYGVHVENARNGMLSSPCEYLSKEAFDEGTRKSSTNKPFEFWLPILAFAKDWQMIGKMFIDSVNQICKAIGITDKTMLYEKVLKVCSSIMNGLVVEIMNNKNNLSANDKFVDGYFAIYRLLKMYSTVDSKIVEYADRELKTFATSPDKRSKQLFPNLGELLIYLTISPKFKWNDISIFFIEESDARNVFWYAVGNYNNPPKCKELANPTYVGNRNEKVFAATEVSRNLIMYQVKFSQVACSLTDEIMESNFGLAPQDLRISLKDTYKEIVKVSTWKAFFEWLSLDYYGDEKRCIALQNAVINSKKFGYTK